MSCGPGREPWPIPELWDQATAVVIGGGPSLDLRQIRHVARAHAAGRCRAIAVNDAVYPCWWADWLHACDQKWWLWHRESAPHFPGLRTTCTDSVPEAWAHYLYVPPPDQETSLRTGMPADPGHVAGGGNGGYQAIQCAVKAGATRVLLLGIDMQPGADGGGTHWFGDHPDNIRSDWEGTMLPNFPGLADVLERRGVEVVNCSPASALDVWPKMNIEDAL